MNEPAVMLSIRPEWCCLIAQGRKTLEVRKTRPKIEAPFKCYIYCTERGRPLVYGDVRCWEGFREEYTQTFGYSKEEARKIWPVYNGHVMGEFICDKLLPIKVFDNGSIQNYMFYGIENSCVPYDDIVNYIGNGCTGYGWNITNLEIYDTPKKITDFFVESNTTYDCPTLVKMKQPPQSWCYVEGDVRVENA